MEYLMTYGWAILIIAVVLGALFQLGVFSTSSFAPRAPPGACQVFRPSGAGTTQNVNLVGVCTGQQPQYVGVFNGQGGYVGVSSGAYLNMPNSLTVSAWVNFNYLDYAGGTGSLQAVAGKGYPDQVAPNAGWWFYYDNRANKNTFPYTCFGNSAGGYSGGGNNFGTYSYNFNAGRWYHLAITVGSSTARLYINGVQLGADLALSNLVLSDPTRNLEIARPVTGFNGLIADVQIYNATLASDQIQAIYLEGIGGPPTKLQNLVGWWPLNGDAKDYSGNNNNGAASSVVFTSKYVT
jgi:hypothetical protein